MVRMKASSAIPTNRIQAEQMLSTWQQYSVVIWTKQMEQEGNGIERTRTLVRSVSQKYSYLPQLSTYRTIRNTGFKTLINIVDKKPEIIMLDWESRDISAISTCTRTRTISD